MQDKKGKSIMKKARKKEGKTVHAYCLGAGSPMEQKMLEEGKIRVRDDGVYELFSQEAKGETGELAYPGDYFKIDSSSFPYPNKKEWFEANHKHINGDDYMQFPKPVDIWEADMPMCEEIQYLLSTDRLHIKVEDTANYFSAFLWGAPLAAAKDAVIVFYSVDRDEDGKIRDVDFNFVARDEFEKTYTVL